MPPWLTSLPAPPWQQPSHSKFIRLSVVRAQHDREFSDGHNGFTADTQNISKRSNHICTIAGSNKDAYAAWLATNRRTHDLHHHLTHAAIKELV